jgi:hypothetical protein
MSPSSFVPWDVWPTSIILMRRAMGGYRQPARHVKVCVRQPPTLMRVASDVAFRYVLNLESFVCTIGYPTTASSMELYAAGCRRTNSFPTHYPVRCLPVTAITNRNRYLSIRNVCLRIRLLPSIVTGCRWSSTIELYSSPDSYKLNRHIGVQNVKHNCNGKDCGFLGARAEKKKKRFLPRLNFSLLSDAINLRGQLTFWVRICNNKIHQFLYFVRMCIYYLELAPTYLSYIMIQQLSVHNCSTINLFFWKECFSFLTLSNFCM